MLVVVLLAGLGALGGYRAVEPGALPTRWHIRLNDKDTYQQEIPTETAGLCGYPEIALKYETGLP